MKRFFPTIIWTMKSWSTYTSQQDAKIVLKTDWNDAVVGRSMATAAVRGDAQLIAPFFISSVQDLTRCGVKNVCNEGKKRELCFTYITESMNNIAHTTNLTGKKLLPVSALKRSIQANLMSSFLGQTHTSSIFFFSRLGGTQSPLWELFLYAHSNWPAFVAANNFWGKYIFKEFP